MWPALAQILEDHREEIARAWAEMVHRLPDSHYRERPLEELRASTMRGLGAIIEALSSGSYATLEAYLTDVSLTRLEMGFDIAEVVEALLLCKDAVMPVIWRAFPPDSATAREAIAQLDGCLRRMIGRFGHLYAEGMSRRLARQAERLRALNEVGRQIASFLSIDELLPYVVTLLKETFHYYNVNISLLDPEAGEMVLRASAGEFTGKPPLGVRVKVGEKGIVSWVAAKGEPLLVNDVTRDPRYYPLEALRETRSELAVPIVVGGKVEGVLDVESTQVGAFSEEDLVALQTLADQIAVAMENARLHAQAQQAAALEERHRLARELHDSVAQAIYGVTLYAEAVIRLLNTGEVSQAIEHLKELRDTAQEALRDMRLLLFELRPPELEQVGLAAALQARLEVVEGRAGLETEFRMEGEGRLPLEIEEGLYRIAQEALNNALKHAQARKITVTLRQDEQSVTLEVADDGIGFDPKAVEGKGMGLRSMAERTRLMGGELEIESELGKGTRVRVNI